MCQYNVSIQCVNKISQYNVSIKSLHTISPYNHSKKYNVPIQCVNTMCQYNVSIQSVHTMCQYNVPIQCAHMQHHTSIQCVHTISPKRTMWPKHALVFLTFLSVSCFPSQTSSVCQPFQVSKRHCLQRHYDEKGRPANIVGGHLGR